LLSSKKRLCTLSALALALAAVACAENVDMGEVADRDVPFAPPAEAGPDAGGDAPELLSCIATECPDGLATCLSESGPAYKCGTDLLRDNEHCGACGNKCLVYKPIHMTSRCVDGACELECLSEPDIFNPVDWRNCNGLVDDGCEINVLSDAKNCGACGNACADGVACIEGKCGCPPGKIACHGRCTDPQSDDNNCGGCGNVCEPPDGACDPMPAGAYYGCFAGTCGHLKCADRSADCNGDLSSASCGGDGCEVPDIMSDRDNCGGCGIRCGAKEECVDEGNGPECAVPCARFGRTACPGGCYDLLTDVNACGGCNSPCRPPGPNQTRACKKGLCAYECQPGFADCNGDPADGCETNLRVHPGNCGACGNTCDMTAGQPCVEGQCLMTTCEPGGAR
jgi:hypothetical protein